MELKKFTFNEQPTLKKRKDIVEILNDLNLNYSIVILFAIFAPLKLDVIMYSPGINLMFNVATPLLSVNLS